MKHIYFVSESVSEGHPDKICDQIAQKILDYCLEKDSNARVACEVFVTSKRLIIGGEIKVNFLSQINDVSDTAFENFRTEIEKLAWTVIKEDIGYTAQSWNNLAHLKIEVLFNIQSKEIGQQVEQNHHLRLGDNTIVFGYACYENSINYFPIHQSIANLIMQKLNQVRKSAANHKFQLAPDGKVEVVGRGKTLTQICLCQQFLYPETEFINFKDVRQNLLFEKIIHPLLEKHGFSLANDFQWEVKPFHIGGPNADTGLTGRKLMVDAYGVYVKHGGGSYIGKDYTKGDCSLALYARFIAKHLVVAGVIDQIEIQISSVIGSQTSHIDSDAPSQLQPIINQILNTVFNWSFEKIIARLHLKRPGFFVFASYGFFGRDDQLAHWEVIDDKLIKEIKRLLPQNKSFNLIK